MTADGIHRIEHDSEKRLNRENHTWSKLITSIRQCDGKTVIHLMQLTCENRSEGRLENLR